MIARKPENDITSYPHADLDAWTPDLPKGRIDRIYTHWSAHDYQAVFPAYHFCVATSPDGRILVVNTHDVRENMRELYDKPDLSYAAHTRGRNAHAIGISIMAMENANPHDFGACPLTEPLIDGLCKVAARLASFYNVAIDAEHVMSHAEAALLDGYFGSGPEERWDIARLTPRAEPLVPSDAIDTGEQLRSRMRRFQMP